MSEYVGLRQGKVHESHIISEYYCGGCGWPVTDHDSYCPECGGALHEGEDKSRWFELFGTPERAARTLEDACFYCDGKLACDDCVIGKMRGFRDTEDEVEEWLRGDAE